jgi:hypothetical protein
VEVMVVRPQPPALSHGDLLSLVQPLAFGMAFWRMEKAMKKYPQEANRIHGSPIVGRLYHVGHVWKVCGLSRCLSF